MMLDILQTSIFVILFIINGIGEIFLLQRFFKFDGLLLLLLKLLPLIIVIAILVNTNINKYKFYCILGVCLSLIMLILPGYMSEFIGPLWSCDSPKCIPTGIYIINIIVGIMVVTWISLSIKYFYCFVRYQKFL